MFTKVVMTKDKIELQTDNGGRTYSLNAADTAAFFDGGGGAAGSGILPVAVRWLSSDLSRFLLERPPTRLGVMYNPTDKHRASLVRNTVPRQLSLPWQLYLVDLGSSSMHVAFATAPITSMDSPVFHAPLPNTSRDGVCRSDAMFTFKGDIAHRLHHAVTQFWATGFNDNMPGHWVTGRNSGQTAVVPPEMGEVTTVTDVVDAYEQASIADVLGWSWVPRGTVADLCKTSRWGGADGGWQAFCSRVWQARRGGSR